jgi:hypothetical protein
MLTLNATLADEKANTYVDLTYANDYWTQHIDSVSAAQWAAYSDAQQTLLLIQACRVIETLHFTEPVDPLADFHLVYDSRNQQIRSVKTNYGRPQKYNYYQHLQFPRTLDVYSDGSLYIPEEIKMAQCEQAIYTANFDPSILATRLQGVTHDVINVGGVSLSQKIDANGSMVSPLALQFCKPYFIKSNMRLQRA